MRNLNLKYNPFLPINILKLLIVILFCTFFANNGYSYTNSEETLFAVNNIEVDITEKTASLAREKAMLQARENAFNTVLKRIVIPQDLSKVPELSATQIFEMVKEVTILEERNSNVRYIARLSIAFDVDSIKNLLSEASIPFILETSKPILILPIYSFENGRPLLWEESNPWRREWNTNCPNNVVVPISLPYGELSDISTINVLQAEMLDETALTKMALSYHTDVVYVLKATLYEGLESRLDVAVSGYNYKTKQKISFDLPLTIYREPDEPLDALLQRAVTRVAEAFEDQWKEEKAVFFSIDSSIILIAKTETLNELNNIVNILEKIPLVQKVTIQATTKEKVQFKLSFAGNISNVMQSINNNGYDTELNRGYWVLKKYSND